MRLKDDRLYEKFAVVSSTACSTGWSFGFDLQFERGKKFKLASHSHDRMEALDKLAEARITVTPVTPYIFQSQSSLLLIWGHLILRRTKMAPLLRLNAVAFISPHNHPILIRTFEKGDELKYHYVAHTSLDVIEERSQCPHRLLFIPYSQEYLLPTLVNGPTKSNDCYLGLLYAMDDIAAYGYITPLKMKIVLALPLTDSVVRDAEVIMVRPYKFCHSPPSTSSILWYGCIFRHLEPST